LARAFKREVRLAASQIYVANQCWKWNFIIVTGYDRM
jgi:hypothetical protein